MLTFDQFLNENDLAHLTTATFPHPGWKMGSRMMINTLIQELSDWIAQGRYGWMKNVQSVGCAVAFGYGDDVGVAVNFSDPELPNSKNIIKRIEDRLSEMGYVSSNFTRSLFGLVYMPAREYTHPTWIIIHAPPYTWKKLEDERGSRLAKELNID